MMEIDGRKVEALDYSSMNKLEPEVTGLTTNVWLSQKYPGRVWISHVEDDDRPWGWEELDVGHLFPMFQKKSGPKEPASEE